MADYISKIKPLGSSITYEIKDANAIPKSIGTAKGDIVYWSAANTPARLGIGSAGQVLKVSSDGIPAWSSDNNSLNWGQITQSGANNIDEGTSDFTDNTEIFSSYASNNGFADTNATGKVFRRDAVKMYNYVKTKLAVTNNNVSVGWDTETTIATIGGTAIKIKIPANPNTNTATAADNILDGSNSGTQITYAPYTSQQSKLSFDTSTTAPTRTDRLNLNGYLYATKLYSGGNEVSVSGHTHTTALATDTGTSSITLAHGGKYKLTAGGTSVIFTMPTDNNTDTLVKQTAKTDNVEYRILTTTSASPTSGNAAEAAYDTGVSINPSTHTVTASTYKVTTNAVITYNTANGCLEITV